MWYVLSFLAGTIVGIVFVLFSFWIGLHNMSKIMKGKP